jgi:hypothetical protein
MWVWDTCACTPCTCMRKERAHPNLKRCQARGLRQLRKFQPQAGGAQGVRLHAAGAGGRRVSARAWQRCGAHGVAGICARQQPVCRSQPARAAAGTRRTTRPCRRSGSLGRSAAWQAAGGSSARCERGEMRAARTGKGNAPRCTSTRSAHRCRTAPRPAEARTPAGPEQVSQPPQPRARRTRKKGTTVRARAPGMRTPPFA